MKRKRWVTLSLAMVLAVTTLAGCSGNSSKEPDNEPAKEVSQVDSDKYKPNDGKVYNIAWLAAPINAPVPDTAELKAYWEKKYNVKFNLWYIERAKWQEILNVKIAAGEFPDVIYVDDANILSSYYNQDLIMELPLPLLEKLAPKITAEVNKVKQQEGFDPWITTRMDGKNYGIPRFNDSGAYPFVSIWREDWLKNVGITKVPETLKEYEEAFYKFVNDDPDKNGKKDTYALSSGYGSEPFAAIYGAFGYIPTYWSVKDGKMIYGGIQPEMKEALTYLAKWYKDKLINPEFITGENRGGHWSISQDLIDGVIGYSNNGPFYVNAPPPIGAAEGGKMYRTFASAHKNDGAKMVTGRTPIGPNGKSGSVRWGVVTGISIAFSKKLEKEPDKLGKILQIMQDIGTDFDTWKIANYGLEGTHYAMENGKFKDLLPKGKPVEEFGLGSTFTAWEASGMVKRWDPAYYEYADKVATFSKEYTNALYTRLPSMDTYGDELNKLQKQTYLEIITGKKPIEAFDEFVKKWNSSGGTKLIEEANKWYTSVNSSK
ncbi:hypothetical protein [Paenibacillus sp. HJGM_3]|uniref:hypothetical protein n=1 Tax=Paenibacillus sp. HJGM_3 TaxID=3379816 RepID=UPI00385AB09C